MDRATQATSEVDLGVLSFSAILPLLFTNHKLAKKGLS